MSIYLNQDGLNPSTESTQVAESTGKCGGRVIFYSEVSTRLSSSTILIGNAQLHILLTESFFINRDQQKQKGEAFKEKVSWDMRKLHN